MKIHHPGAFSVFLIPLALSLPPGLPGEDCPPPFHYDFHTCDCLVAAPCLQAISPPVVLPAEATFILLYGTGLQPDSVVHIEDAGDLQDRAGDPPTPHPALIANGCGFYYSAYAPKLLQGASPGFKDITVTDSRGSAVFNDFVFYAGVSDPYILSVTPSEVPPEGGTLMRFDGRHLRDGLVPMINGVECLEPMFASPDETYILARAPTLDVGVNYPAQIRDGSGTLLTCSENRVFVVADSRPPRLTSVEPAEVDPRTPTVLTVHGENFRDGANVNPTIYVLGVTTQLFPQAFVSPQVITISAPILNPLDSATPPGPRTLHASDPRGDYFLPGAFTYVDKIRTVTPAKAVAAGGTTLTFRGFGFESRFRMKLGGMELLDQAFIDPTTFVGTLPVGVSPQLPLGLSDATLVDELEAVIGFLPRAVEVISPRLVPLDLGLEATATLSAAEQSIAYVFTPPIGKTVTITLTDPDAEDTNALYFRWGALASPEKFDQAADRRELANQRLVVPSTRAQPCYILIQANVLHGGTNDIRLLATLEDLSLESISPGAAGRGGSGEVTASILGGGFGADAAFRLEPSGGGTMIAAAAPQIIASHRAEATFAIKEAEPGTYDLVAEGGGTTARLAKAFEVLATNTGPRLETAIRGPRFLRYGRVGRLTVSYENRGDEDMPAPLFQLTAPSGTELKLETDGEFHQNVLQFLGTHSGGVAGRLPPGGSGQAVVRFKNTVCPNCELEFQLQQLQPSPADFVRWNELPTTPGIGNAEWAALLPALSVLVGATWEDYASTLSDVATRLSHRGVPPASVRTLLRFLVRRARSSFSSAVLGTVIAASDGSPLPGVNVLALEGGTVRSAAITDAEGGFALDFLRPGGLYQLAAAGFSFGDVRVPVPEKGDLTGIVLSAVPEANALTPACPDCDESGLPLEPMDLPPSLLRPLRKTVVTTVSSFDPNKKEGSTSQGEVDIDGVPLAEPGEPILYRVLFDNIGAAATASAYRVVVTDQLDPALDWSTFRQLDVQIGTDSRQAFSFDSSGIDRTGAYTRDLGSERYKGTAEINVHQTVGVDLVEIPTGVKYEIDLQTGMARWELESPIDDEHPTRGFLLPNDSLGQSEGSISFSVQSRADLTADTSFENDALIQFDDPLPGRPPVKTDPGAVIRVKVQGPPVRARNPNPPDSAESTVSADTAFQWDAAKGTLSDIYLWRKGAPKPAVPAAAGLSDSFYRPGVRLIEGVEFQWQVDSRNEHGTTEGKVWSFRTAPAAAPCPAAPSRPFPQDGAEGVSPGVVLGWDAPERAETYDVYVWFSIEPRPSLPVARGFTGTELDLNQPDRPPPFLPQTSYHFQVVALSEGCSKPGDIWHFTTGVPGFSRGDADGNGALQLTDAVRILNVLFLGTGSIGCLDAADADDNGDLQLTDAVRILNVLFLGTGTIPPPGPTGEPCGGDPTEDGLGCGAFPRCG